MKEEYLNKPLLKPLLILRSELFAKSSSNKLYNTNETIEKFIKLNKQNKEFADKTLCCSLD